MASRCRNSRRSPFPLRVEGLESRRLLAVIPAGFTETVLADRLTSPTTLDIAPDGRVWVAFQDGRIGVIDSDTSGVELAFQLDCDGSAEHGLQGLELDPEFESNHFIYVYYTANSPAPHNRISRLTVDPTTEDSILPGSEVPLLELPNLADYGNPPWHIGGAVQIGLDGTLYVQIGESQQSAQSQDLDSPLGKILHLNVDGTPAANNPYLDASDGITWRDYVWASGLRNPFASDLNPVTGQYFVCDVGQGSWEEINDATLPGQDFGWPTTEGPFNQQAFPNASQPFYAYSHANGCAITGGAFNPGGTTPFPAEYQGQFFFSEFCSSEIRLIDPANPAAVRVFATGADFPMNIEFGPDGAMYYVARGAGAGGAPGIGTGSIQKIAFASNLPPRIVSSPSDMLVSADYDATFVAAATGSAPLEYRWQSSTGGDFLDVPGAASPTLVVAAAGLKDSGTQYRVVVTNPLGTAVSAPATLTVTADTPPTPFITLPAAEATYRAGDTIVFSGGASDQETGDLPASQLTWRIEFHHNVHSHPFIPPTSGITRGQFTIPVVTETDADVFYRISLTAIDSAGLVTETHRDLLPLKSNFIVESNLPDDGGSFFVDSHAVSAPFATTGVENVVRTLEAPRLQSTAGTSVVFSQWLDGVSDRTRTINTPQDDTAYVALYATLAGEAVYLSDLTPTGTPTNGWGPIERDMSNGEQAAGDGRPITLNGVVYDKGLGVHANSEVIYTLGGQYDRFLADIGVDDESDPGGTVVFRVLVDGVERLNSGMMNNATATKLVDLDVRGADELRLLVETAADGNGNDHADWANARLIAVSNLLVDINFQLAGVPVPVDSLADTGLVYGNRGNGWSYGWSSDHTDVSRDRDINADQRLDTLIHIHAGQFWEISLPNGTYEVTASIGDAGFTSTHTLNVEGISYWNERPLAANEFALHADLVVVTDGRLTLDMGAAADKATRINYLRIAVPVTEQTLLPFSAADIDLNARLDPADVLAFAAGWGTDGSSFTLEQQVRHGDLNFDGNTDGADFDILNARWIEAGNAPLNLTNVLSPTREYDVPAWQTKTLAEPLTGPVHLLKRGDGVLVLDGANTHSGGTVVTGGVVEVRNPAAFGSGPLIVQAGATVRFDVNLASVPLDQLQLEAGAIIDIGTGGLTIAAGGFDAAILRQWIIDGGAGGTWLGSSGIRSTAAAAARRSRTIGYTVQPDGSATVLWTVIGDLDLDRDVDAFDMIAMNAGGGFGTGQVATWAQGDFDYNGRADVFDLIRVTSGGGFGTGTIAVLGQGIALRAAPLATVSSSLDANRLAAFSQLAVGMLWESAGEQKKPQK